jgi:hypothetical protein
MRLYILFDSKGFDGIPRIPTQDWMGASSRLIPGFVDPAIGAATNEAYHIVVVVDAPLASVSRR